MKGSGGHYHAVPHFLPAKRKQPGYIVPTPMNTCPCIESLKTLVTTGKWTGVPCECGKKLPLSHLMIAGVVGFVLATVVATLLSRSRRS